MIRFFLWVGVAATLFPPFFPSGAAFAQSPVAIDLRGALARARTANPQYLSAVQDTLIAGEDIKQSRAALLPKASYNNQYIYSQGNGTDTGRFVGANGVHEYISQGIIEETFSQTSRLEYRQSIAAAAVAKAKQEVASRGIAPTVIRNYYALISAQRRLANARQNLIEAQSFLDSTKKLETNGEVAHLAVVQAQNLPLQRQREVDEALYSIEKAQVELAILILPDYNTPFSVIDDLQSPSPAELADITAISAKALETSPDLRAAKQTLRQQSLGAAIARSEFLPSFTAQYNYGIDANRFATHTNGLPNLGSSVQGTLNIPVFNWGATRSRIRQAEARQKQAEAALNQAQKELSSGAQLLYKEAQVAKLQLDSLKASLDLAVETERLTRLAYAAGEASVLEVVDAQRTLTEARNDYDDGLARYQIAWANIQVITGVF